MKIFLGVAPLLGLGGFLLGKGRFALVGALLAWGALGVAFGASPHRRVLGAGGVLTVLLALMNSSWGGTFFFHRIREVPGWRFSVGVVAVQGALMTTCLLSYGLMRSRAGRELSSAATALLAFGFGLAFEQLGKDVWVWNEYTLPRAFLGEVPAFVPIGWGGCFLFSGYFLSTPRTGMPPALTALVAGLRCGAGYGASFLLWWAVFLKWHGRALAL